MNSQPQFYRVYSAPGVRGGKRIAVFDEALSQGTPAQLQGRAAAAGALSVFIENVDADGVHLDVYTPTKHKGESDSGAIAALRHLQARGAVADLTSVWMQGQEYAAQLCSGEWLLSQGDGSAHTLEADPASAAATVGLNCSDLRPATPLVSAEAGRPNLLLALRDAAALDRATPNAEAVAALNRATGTLGLVVYSLGGRQSEDVDFRYFAPLKNITEDNASSNTYATLLAGLSVLGLLDTQKGLYHASQGYAMGLPSRLSAQATLVAGGAAEVWVGGAAHHDH